MGKNAKILHQFVNGFQKDLDDNAEKNDSYQEGINGRLYSKNGVLSYSSIQGTVEVYNNPKIVKYLGYWPFLDSLAIFVKHIPTAGRLPEDPGYSDEDLTVISSNFFDVVIPFGSTEISFLNQIHSNTTSEVVTIPVKNPNPLNDDDYDQDLSCITGSGETIDYDDYYIAYPNNTDEACSLELLDETPLNNEDFSDAIYLIRKDKDTGVFSGTLMHEGNLNWDINRKIITYGIYESNFYQRVYFTDYLNPFSVVNFKDKELINRLPEEFHVFQGGANLSPQVHLIEDGGQIKASTVFYSYRLITSNGQVTIFAPPSLGLIVEYDSGDISFRGGDIDEITSKKVTIQCNVIDHEKFEEIEAIAIEYSAQNIITSIRNLGTKNVNEVNYFEHVGNEEDLSDNITSDDIFERVSYWKYCSDLNSKGNVLFASAIRNEPLPSEILNISKDFLLHSWDENGNTHECLINPEPWTFRYFDPKNTDDFYYINKKRYNSIQIFGSYVVKLVNKSTGEEYTKSFLLTGNDYVLQTKAIFDWLEIVKDDANFTAWFPNLLFRYENESLFFDPIDDNIATDISNYVFKFNTTQVIQDIDEDVELINLNIGTANLTYGGISLGYNRGNGIRVSYNVEQDELIKSKTGSSSILDLEKPSLKKSFLKGEIYRVGITLFDLKGAELFVIPMGDIMIPKFGENQKIYVEITGDVITLNVKYRNSFESGDKLWAERIVLNVNVRLSCETMQHVSMYQIMYVPRTENNRTILCQGIAAPLERMNKFEDAQHIPTPDIVTNKWCLPLQGGPTYDHLGLQQYDLDPYQEDEVHLSTRITTNRSLLYFDSPDLIFNRISSNLIKSSQLQRVARLNIDNPDWTVRSTGVGVGDTPPPTLPPPFFSKRILEDDIAGESWVTKLVNLSVFSKETEGLYDDMNITHAADLHAGEIIPGNDFGLSHEISNNALTFGKQAYFYVGEGRQSFDCGILENGSRYEIFKLSSYTHGRKTIVIKTVDDVFSNPFINKESFEVGHTIDDYQRLKTVDTHSLINIVTGRQETVYGGRSENAYSKNVYKPLSDTIPVMKVSTIKQKFFIEGDVYVTLHVRLKTDFTDKSSRIGDSHDFNMGGSGCVGAWTYKVGGGAWAYAYVVETEVEPRLSWEKMFYTSGAPYDFEKPIDEIINEAYFQEYVKNSIPKPFRFKDDPNLFNLISASKTKLSGEFFDAWSIFPANNFYEVEKDKGAALNLAKNTDDIFVIQENQTCKLIVNPRTMVPTGDGQISIQQSGDGGPVVDHDIVSNYGTAIRRGVVQNDFGFEFIDEKRFEFIKINKPLLLPNLLGFFLRDLFKEKYIENTEGYYDDEYKETNFLIKGANDLSVMLSYNEAFKVFNGTIQYDNSIYMPWNDDILVPKNDTIPYEDTTRPDESSLHLLNSGNELSFFGDQKTLKIGVTSHLKSSEVLIFKHWAADMNIDYAIKEINVETRLGHSRTIEGTHHRYKIREGIHSVPLKNRMDIDDLRGKWMYIEVEIESINNSKINVFSFINFVRNSYI